MQYHKNNKKEWWYNAILSVYRGYRNGVITGVRIRTPYVLQSLIYLILFYDKAYYRRRLTEVLKQMFYHGRNLGSFVLIYKTVTLICRKFGISNGIECWIAGFIGGSTAFGNNKNLSGSVNNQIVLYLFARGLEAALNLATEKRLIPQILDVRKPTGFRIFAGFSLALILYMTEYRSNLLKPPFFRTMDHLYNESNSGSLHIPREYILFVFLISTTLLMGDLFNIQQLKLDYILSQSENILQWFLDLLLGRPIDK